MRLYAAFVYLFLYIPIAVIAIFSFNAGRNASDFVGFAVKWYGKALDNPFIMDALKTSLTVALLSALFASVFGAMAAVAMAMAVVAMPAFVVVVAVTVGQDLNHLFGTERALIKAL